MLKLTKYELRKNRTALIVIAIGFLLLQGYFMYTIVSKNEMHSAASCVMLALYGLVCYFTVFIMAIANYSKELNSKSSYLIFMTPNSPLNIIFSKMLNILLIGTVIVLIFIGLFFLNMKLLTDTYPELGTFAEFIDELVYALGWDITMVIAEVLYMIIWFLISFFASVTLVYLAITLSATLLQNTRFRGFVSFVFYIVLSLITGWISDKLPIINESPQDTMETMINLVPGTLFELAVMIISIVSCSYLLDKKLSL